MYFPVQIKALMEMWVQHKVLNCAGTVRIVNPLIIAERSFTCMKRKLVALSLALAIVLGCSVTAFAGSTSGSDVYNGQGYGYTDKCTTTSVYSETGSSSDYLLKASATYYYAITSGGSLRAATITSGSYKKVASVSLTDSTIIIDHITGYHYVGGYIAKTVTVYA